MPVEGFKVDIEKAVGHQFASEKVSCNRRDFLLYALGVGVKEDELQYLYEFDKAFAPLPTYPLALLLKGDTSDINNFKDTKEVLPGMPYYNPNNIVHGEQSLVVHKLWPVLGGSFSSKKTCTGVFDKGSGMVIETTIDIYDEAEKVKYCSMVSKAFVRGYGGWNGPKGPKGVSYNPPKHKPDAVEIFAPLPNQALLYRLSGDYNTLHADPAVATAVGFPKPILHGLCTYGAVGHLIIKALANNEPARFKSIEGRFASPIFPGETVDISMWIVDSQDPKTDGVIFIAKAKERDTVVINNGYATIYKKTPDESKL